MRLSIFKEGKCYFIKYPPLPYVISLEILTYQNNNITFRKDFYDIHGQYGGLPKDYKYITLTVHHLGQILRKNQYVQLHHGFPST